MNTLFHYTTQAGMLAILSSGILLPSTRARNPHDVRYGEGQYLSDIPPGTMSAARLSRALIGQPFQGHRFTHYVEIDVRGLPVTRGRAGVYVILGTQPLDVTGRIVSSGAN
jgi:hypothetical protein